MGEIFAGSITTALNRVKSQAPSDLKEYTIRSSVQNATSQLERAQSIFNQRQSNFSTTEKTFFAKAFEEAITEQAYKALEGELSRLRFKERSFDNAHETSTKSFIDHEKQLRATPEIQGIESKIQENRVKIFKKQKALAEKSNTDSSYKSNLKVNSMLANEVSQLQNVEMSLVGAIESIKAQIQQIRSGNFSLSDLQINITGSSSTSSVDTGKLITSDSSSAAVLGGQQIAETKGIQELLENAKASTQVSQKHEEIKAQIKDAILAKLEALLSEKESQLEQTRKQLNIKQGQLNDNDTKVESYEKDSEGKTSDRASLEEEIEQLIQETQDLIQERIDKDPEFVRFSKFTNFFNNFLKGSGNTGAGITPELERKKEDFSEIQEKYEQKSSDVNNLDDIFGVKQFLKSEAKANLSSSRSYTEEQKQLFQTFKQKYSS